MAAASTEPARASTTTLELTVRRERMADILVTIGLLLGVVIKEIVILCRQIVIDHIYIENKTSASDK